MRRAMRLSLAVMAGVGFLALSAPAFAMDGDCLWNSLDASWRTAFLADAQARGMEALSAADLKEDQLTAAATACHVSGPQADVAGSLLGAMITQKAAMAWLQSHKGINEAALNVAWNAWPRVSRDVFVAGMNDRLAHLDDKDYAGPDVMSASKPFRDSLKLGDDRAANQMAFIYLYARVGRATFEAK